MTEQEIKQMLEGKNQDKVEDIRREVTFLRQAVDDMAFAASRPNFSLENSGYFACAKSRLEDSLSRINAAVTPACLGELCPCRACQARRLRPVELDEEDDY